MPTLLCRARPFRNLFRIGSGVDSGSAPILLLLLLLCAFRLSGLPRLKLFHVDGGSGIQLISEPDSLKTLGPAVSPDGRYIWYSRRTGDWQYNAQLPQYQLEAY